ncbi:MAG: hypothetical protein JF587_23470 [Catenulisporales bacterium]|jgi:hypothetical protein|nr:hypothetical protein [Catenulisporales bacterium]
MSEQTGTTTASTGGFLGDQAEAFTTPAGGGCCGGPVASSGDVKVDGVAGPCCGTAREAKAESSCCGTEAKVVAVASGNCGCG